MKRFGDESGQTLIMVALGMTVLLGFLGFATDVGVLLHEKRQAQSAADSAALAGASRIKYGYTAVKAAALYDAARNGFTDGSNGVTVTVKNPPLTGSFANPNFVQVSISQSTPLNFMKSLGFSSMAVAASAIAGDGAPSSDCVIVLSKTSPNAMNLQGSFDVSTPGCGVVVDSNSPSALYLGGQSGTLTAGSVGVVGAASGQISDSNPTPIDGVDYVNDPLIGTPVPDFDDLAHPCSTSQPPSGTSTTSVEISNPTGVVCYKTPTGGTINLSNVILDPGVYVFDNPGYNLKLSGNITGNGVMLYLLGGLDTSSQSYLNLTCSEDPASPYNTILLWDNAPAPGNTLNFSLGTATGQVTGLIYAPHSMLQLQDSGGAAGLSLTTDLIVNQLYDKTASLKIVSYTDTIGNGSSLLTHITLVE